MTLTSSPKQRLRIAAAAVLLTASAQAAPISKADNTDNLNLTTSWTGGVVPGASDVATWDATVTGANTTVLGADLSFGGLAVTNPGGAVTIGAGNTLTLGTGGIDMSTATQNLTVSSGLVLGTGGQTWNIASGRLLTTGAFTKAGAGATLRLDQTVNTGAVTASPSLVNGIVGPWASIANAGAASNNATGGYTYATVSAGNLQPYTGATSQTLTTAWGGIGSGGTGTINYDISSSTAVLGATGLGRNINTIRYTGSGARQPGNNAGDLLTINGIMNSGTGEFTLGRNGANIANDFSFGIVVGATGELVLAPMTANISLYSFIKNGSNGGNVTVMGNNTVTLGGNNTYTGATNVNGGTLLVSGSGAINSTSGITVNGGNAKYLHTSSVASTRTLTLTRGTVDGTGTLGTVTVADNAANVVANGNGGTTTLTFGSLAFAGDATANLTMGSGLGFNVTGTLTTTPASGTVTINASKTGWAVGSNNIIGFGSFSGSAGDFTLGTVGGLGARQSAGSLAVSGNFIALNVLGDLPVWTGTNGSAWTTSTTGDNSGPSSWATKTGQAVTNFWAADTPEFNDTYNVGGGDVAVTNRSVDIQGANVAPGVVTFNNSTGDYTLSSTTGHGIAGTASLVKSGTSDLVITNTNTFNGSTTINGGALRIGDGTTDGSIAATSGITNNGSLVYNLTGSQSYGGVISGTGSVTKQGGGTLTLTANNTYQGGTTISAGTVTVGSGGSLGTGNVTVATGASLNLTGNYTTNAAVSGGGDITSTGSHTINGDFTGFSGTYTHNSSVVSTGLNSATATSEDAAYVIASVQGSSQGMIAAGNGNYTLKMGSLSGVANSLFRGGNSATGTTTLEIGNLNTDTTFAGSINNGLTKTIALTKVGTGKLELSGSNGYTGNTVVAGGILAVNGSLGNTAVTVQNGATLQGNATIGSGTASVSIDAGATIAPGNSIGSMTIGGDISISGTYDWEFDGTAADLLDIDGTLTLSGATLDVTDLTPVSWALGLKLTVAAYNSLSGSFSGLSDDTIYTLAGNEWLLNYDDATAGSNGGAGNAYITRTAIPEPSAALLGLASTLLFLRRRR